MISFISSLEIINVVKPDPNIFLWITTSVVDAAAAVVNPNGIKTLSANALSTFPIKDNPAFCIGPVQHSLYYQQQEFFLLFQSFI